MKNTNLNVYDGTELEPPALITLTLLNPNLTCLRADFCSQLDDVLYSWPTSLPSLVHLGFLGPFLIHPPAWIYFQLEALLLHQSPRFDLECMSALAARYSNLTVLRLKKVGKLDDALLPYISPLRQLEQIYLSPPSTSSSKNWVITLLERCSARLTQLDNGMGGG